MIAKDMFPIPMLWEKTELDTDRLATEILRLRNTRPADESHYTSYYKHGLSELPDGLDRAVFDVIRAHTDRYLEAILKGRKVFTIVDDDIEAWWNVYTENIHHCWHDHGASVVSGTIFVHTDEQSARFEIRSPLKALCKAWLGVDMAGRWTQEFQVVPDAGTILIWPSWVEHSVAKQEATERPRITISFNVYGKR